MPSSRKNTASPSSAHMQRLQLSAEIMRALAHPLRLRLIEFIDQQQTACVSDIHATLSIEQSLVSQHLRVMRQAGLVTTHRNGKFVYYELNYDRLEKAGFVATSLFRRQTAAEPVDTGDTV